MKRTILFLAAAAVALAVFGCSDENKPTITRLIASPTCGVAPLAIEVYGVASGGNETGPATGGNNNLEFTWDFGDGTSSTSISYHTYQNPGRYVIRLHVEDPDGNSAEDTVSVYVIPDSLIINAFVEPTGPVTTADTLHFDFTAESCGVDPASTTDRASYVTQRWNMGDGTVYTGPSPRHTYAEPGSYEVVLTASYTGWAVTRRTTLTVDVTAAP